MIWFCNMLFDSSKHCNLMLSLLILKLLLYAILPCVLEHVPVISGDSSVFMFCYSLPVLHAHAFCYHVELLQHIVLMLAICLVAILDRLLLCLVQSVCVEPLLRFECALYETCLILHEISYYHVASLFWCVCLMFACILHQCHV